MSDRSAPFHKILIATDFSPSAQAAIPRGVWLAEQSGAPATLVHVLTNLREAFLALPYEAKSEFLYGDIEQVERALRAESQQKLAKAVQRFWRQKRDVQTEVLLGKAEHAITRAVLSEKFDTVVVGTRGLTGVKRYFLGSTAARLVRQCPATVWAVKAENAWPPKRIVVGVDFSELSRRALEMAGWLAERSQALLDVVHVIEDDDVLTGLKSRQRERVKASDLGQQMAAEAAQRLEEWAEAALAPSTVRAWHVLWGTPWKVLADRARRWKCDLAVMGAAGRSGMSGLLIGNTAEKLLNHCDCSLLTVKPPEFVSAVLPPCWDLHPAEG